MKRRKNFFNEQINRFLVIIYDQLEYNFHYLKNQSNMFLEEIRGLCCRGSSVQQESRQEHLMKQYSDRNTFDRQLPRPQTNLNANCQPKKTVFSFKQPQKKIIYNERNQNSLIQPFLIRYKSEPGFNSFKQEQRKLDEPLRSTLVIKKQYIRPPQVFSPRPTQLRDMKSPPSKIYSNLYSLTVEPQKPKLKFQLKPHQGNFKMQGKRIKTAEEETEYSSKHSQIHFRNSNEGTQNSNHSFFQKKTNNSHFNKNYFFHEEDMQSLHSILPQEFPSCREVSAHEEADNSVSNQYLQNARSIHTIAGSSGLRSKMTSKQNSRHPSNALTFAKLLPLQSPCLSPRISSQIPDCPALIAHASQTPKMPFSPIRYTCPSIEDEKVQGSKLNSSIFYSDETSKKSHKSPRVSVLSVLDMDEQSDSEEEELRDVIDHQIIQRSCSINTSPFGSVNTSLKNVVDERKDKRILQFRTTDHNHSRDQSDELTLLREMRYHQKRTNTFESVDSSTSENSYLDIKFMQKHRTRREVSKLIRD